MARHLQIYDPMNASNPLPVIGHGGSSLLAVSGQAPGSPESAFADSLAAAISGSLVQPVPVPSPVVAGLDVLSLSKGDNAGTNNLDSFLNDGSFGLIAPLLSVDLRVQGNLFEPVTPDLDLDVNPNLEAGPRLTVSRPMAPEMIEGPTLPSPQPGLAQDLQPETGLEIPPPPLSSPVKATDKLEQTLPLPRQPLPNHADPKGIGVTATNLIESSSQEPLADLSKTIVNLDKKPLPVQREKLPAPQALFVQQTAAQTDRPLSNAEYFAQARSPQARSQQIAGNVQALSKPVVPIAVQNIKTAEAFGIDLQPSAEPTEIFASDINRIELAGTGSSKPVVQPPQPPNMQIALQIARAVPQGIDRISVQLHPADLGAVEIQLDFADGGHVSALIIAERPETLEMLQRDSRTLERSLNNAGLQLENGGLTFSLKQEQNQQGQGFDTSSRQHNRTFSDDQAHEGAGDSLFEQEPIRISQQRLLDIHT